MSFTAQKRESRVCRDNLTWSPHALLAAEEPADQAYWLDRAAALCMSVDDLRVELRTARRSAGAASHGDGETRPQGACGDVAMARRENGSRSRASGMTEIVTEGCIICPHCGHLVPLPPALPGGGGNATASPTEATATARPPDPDPMAG